MECTTEKGFTVNEPKEIAKQIGYEDTKLPTLNGKEPLYNAAISLLKRGYSVGIVTDEKRPVVPTWKKYQATAATNEEIVDQLIHPNAYGICIFTGYDGNEVIDLDLKCDNTGTLETRLENEIERQLPGLLQRLPKVRSRSGGKHYYYKSEIVEGNQKLANRPTTEEERHINPKEKSKAIIETRGAGGLIVTAPTPGYTSERKCEVPLLTIEERETLLSICRSFNEVFKETNDSVKNTDPTNVFEITPWDDYNTRGIDDMLQRLCNAGWNIDQRFGNKVRFTRPGKNSGTSAEWDSQKGKFFVFTSSSEFDSEHGYTPSSVFKILECGGDASKCSKELEALGYGKRKHIETVSLKNAVQYNGFWTNNGRLGDYQLSTGLITDILTKTGWRVLNKRLVHVKDGVVYKKEEPELYEYVIDMVSSQEISFRAKDITFTVDATTLKTKAQQTLKGRLGLLALPSFEFKIMRDTRNECFFHFANKSMKVTKDAIVIFDRNENDGVIWEEQLLKHEIKEDDLYRPVFADFLMNVAGDNFNAFRSGIGRMLHNYNTSQGFRILWLCDASYKAMESNGRSGKGIFMKSLGRCRNMVIIDGKNYTPENRFKHQSVDDDTQIMALDDVTDSLDFKSLYCIPTEGLEAEKKNIGIKRFTLEETPQMVITSNTPPKLEEGASTRGRLFILPFKDFYTGLADQGGIAAHHDHIFFDDWDSVEWNRFYWFMAVCVRDYFKEGYVFADQAEIRKNRLKEIYSKKVGKDIADELAEYVYTLPKSYTLEMVMEKFGADVLDRKETKKYASCLKDYYNIEGKVFDNKVRETVDGKQRRMWKEL